MCCFCVLEQVIPPRDLYVTQDISLLHKQTNMILKKSTWDKFSDYSLNINIYIQKTLNNPI